MDCRAPRDRGEARAYSGVAGTGPIDSRRNAGRGHRRRRDIRALVGVGESSPMIRLQGERAIYRLLLQGGWVLSWPVKCRERGVSLRVCAAVLESCG